jgi:hypothetical protein
MSGHLRSPQRHTIPQIIIIIIIIIIINSATSKITEVICLMLPEWQN